MELLNRIDPATQQTAAGFPNIKTMQSALCFTAAEKKRLRSLAGKVAEIAALPVQREKAELWTRHNDLETSQPLVFIDPENGWNECIPASGLLCADPLARVWEMYFLKQIYWFEIMRDDKVIDHFFDVPYSYETTGWGVELKKEGGERDGAYKVIQAVGAYETDFPKLHFPEIIIDEEESERILALAEQAFGDLLHVRRKATWWWTLGMTWDYINLRGLEDFMCDFLLEPEWVHRMMEFLCSGLLSRLEGLQEKNLLPLNTGNTYIGSGGFGFTKELPAERDHVTMRDIWGFVESQETTAISPDLYGEFIFPYHKKIAERFGLMCYGCCEPFDPRWKYVKQLPRLRRVSCSPWADWEKIPELLGTRYVASVKPNPNVLAFPVMEEDAARRDVRHALRATKGCIPEIIMKDNNTLGRAPGNAARWVQIVREEIGRL